MRKYMMAAIALLIAVPAWGVPDASVAVNVTVETYYDLVVPATTWNITIDDDTNYNNHVSCQIWTNNPMQVDVTTDGGDLWTQPGMVITYALSDVLYTGTHTWECGDTGDAGDSTYLWLQIISSHDTNPGSYSGNLLLTVCAEPLHLYT